MMYQIGDFVSQNKNQAIIHLAGALKEDEDIFDKKKNNNTKDTGENCEDTKIDNNIVFIFREMRMMADETISRFRDMFTTYCVEIAQDILAEEGVEGCYIM